MRDPRYRFSDEVRAATRAAALRMVHAGTVAASPAELDEWLARTDDLRAELTSGGYGSAFTADDLFPLYEGFVAKAGAAAPAPATAPAGGPQWLRIALIVVAAIVIGVIVSAVLAAS